MTDQGPRVAIQAVTGAALSPELPGVPSESSRDVDVARAREYGLLAVLLARAPDRPLLRRIAAIEGGPTPLGAAHASLAQAATDAQADSIEREYFELFVGVGRGELMPYGSYYRTGFINERPLARLREDLLALGIERVEGETEPEDHAALLCEIMAGLIDGRLRGSDDAQQGIFDRHLAPWMGRFFADLEQSESADFYRHVGTIGRLFIEIERAAFALPV